jgi:D-alanyl-D-alanine carboxypeptidase/D-alanyl-D-alanine-endopeptidase (penicillin-binding protein 4)
MPLKNRTVVALLALLLLWPLLTPAQQQPVTTPTPQAIPQATPTPQAAPAPRTIEELRARIQEVLDQPQLAPAMLAAKVASLDTGRVLFEANAGKLLMPASNMKLYTVAAALDRLGPEFHFGTSVYAQERPDKAGKVRGDLIIYGRGDPTYATRFQGGDYYKAFDELAARIVAAGVKRIEGDLVGDESYFTGPPLGIGWEWDDLQGYDAAEVTALTVDDNALDLSVKPGARVGDAALVTTGPANPMIRIVTPKANEEMAEAPNFITIVNRAVTAPRGAKRELSVVRPLGRNLIEVTGSIAQDDSEYKDNAAVKRPALLFTAMLRAALEKQGVTIKGRTRVVDAKARALAPLDLTKLVEVAKRESPPFSEVAAQTLKPSQNLYAELILRTLGRQSPAADPKQTSSAAGSAVVRAFLREAGVSEADRLVFYDGSGLSRHNLITADATVQLLTYMSRHRYAQVWRDAQPIAGVDGTLRNRMKNTPAAGNVRAKTGTLDNVAALSGYVTSAAGERLVFSLLVNHYPLEAAARRSYLDAVAVMLAAFTGRS